MKVLITGGAGFIGGHLAALLTESGCSVEIVDNFARGVQDAFLSRLLETPTTRLLNRNLLKPGDVDSLASDYDYIYHLAAIVGVQHVLNRPYDVLADNVRMLDGALAVARRQHRLKRFVFASTSEVYAGSLLAGSLAIPTPETTPLVLPGLREARTSYMLSKVYGEAMCHASGLPVTVVRPHNFYGPRMGLSHVVPELLKRAYHAPAGGVLEVFSVDHQRTFCYIDDGVAQIRALAESPAGLGEAFNVGTASPEVTIGRLAELVIEVVGRSLTVVPLAATVGSPQRRCPDTSRADLATGIVARVPLDEGLRRTFTWYRDTVFEQREVSAV